MRKQSSKETFNYMKKRGKIYIFVSQPMLFSGVPTTILVGFQFLFLWYDYGQNLAIKIIADGLLSGWRVILFFFIGLYIILAILNGARWLYYKSKSM